jgi:glycine/D-amino acid oxidase-like deaminating enzyme/nitrite reductase/ring-hydroxylating ferredoxin subunit
MVLNQSVWRTDHSLMEESLTLDVTADVCIVGAGIAGMSTAYLLSRAGKSVVVLDDGPIGGGETGRTTAHLSFALDDRYYELERLHGRRASMLAASSHRAAIDRIEGIIGLEGIACEFERLDGYLFAPPDGSIEELELEREAIWRAGMTDVDFVSCAPIPDFDTGRCLRFPRQAQFHPLNYLSGLAQAVKRYGGRIFTGTHADTLSGSSPMIVATAGGAIVRADTVVMATNSPIWDSYGIYSLQSAYRTYAIGVRMPAASLIPALYWDTSDPYHYVRLQRGEPSRAHDILIVGGEDHKTGQSDDYSERFARLEVWARERFHGAESIEFQWSGQVMEPVDGMAFIGRSPFSEGNLYLVTGDSGNGLTHGTIAGVLLTDLISGRTNEWSDLYDPSRITLGALPEFAKESVNTVAQYADWITEADVDSRDRIAPGSGATIARGSSKTAAYRDESGRYYECSAVCPHFGCIVSWNDSAKSWDCPCHGSRFDPYGRVVNGPADRNLDEKDSSLPLGDIVIAGVRTATLLTINMARKLLTLGIRVGS